MVVGSPLTVAGAAAELHTRHCCRSTRTAFPWLSPCGEPPLACWHRGPDESRSAAAGEPRRLPNMRRLSIIGIGAGNPDHITVQAIKALGSVDAIFLIGKGSDKEDL